jgi:hypothetical protein
MAVVGLGAIAGISSTPAPAGWFLGRAGNITSMVGARFLTSSLQESTGA